MTELASTSTDLFTRDSREPSVLVTDGYGISLTVHRGHLVVADGIGKYRRERRLPRAQREVRRIVILGHTGSISLEAVRWCTDLGIALLQFDTDGQLLLTAGITGNNDARLRRAQAAAPNSQVGLDIARSLLSAKLGGQAAVANELLAKPVLADTIRQINEQLSPASDLVGVRDLEAQASNAYFGGWNGTVQARFAERDRLKIPDHWSDFVARRSPLHRGGRSPHKAADPINAVLNFLYALAEAECRIAAVALGLDPGMGIVHNDAKNRDSLALDLLEPLRPVVERHVLRLLRQRHLRAADFHETREGSCRLLPPLTHELAEALPVFARAVAKLAEQVAHALASSSPGKIALTTPLSRTNHIQAQTRGRRSSNRRDLEKRTDPAYCRSCGVELTEYRRQLCPTCWPVERAQQAAQRRQAGLAAMAELRAKGQDPSNTPAAAAKRSATQSRRKREQLAWAPTEADLEWTEERYREDILPSLASVPLSRLMEVTGLSDSACSRIRRGVLTPHRRHWRVLATLLPTS